MRFLLGVCAAISIVFALAWVIGGGLQPAAFVIVGVPWLFVAIHALFEKPYAPPMQKRTAEEEEAGQRRHAYCLTQPNYVSCYFSNRPLPESKPSSSTQQRQ